MLVCVSHGWFFQCHPDPFGDKKLVLLDMVRRLRAKYPLAEVLVFFDFLSLSQQPYLQGQARRTKEEQEVFQKALTSMHHCYCYSDALFHLYADPPVKDERTHKATVNIARLELAQLGTFVQVVGSQQVSASNDVQSLEAPAAFDIICEIDGVGVSLVEQVPLRVAEVGYLVRPYGMINIIPVGDRGWVYLERFITMLKTAMLDDIDFDNCVFTNSDATRGILRDGAQLLQEAAEGDSAALTNALSHFKKELSKALLGRIR